MPHYTIAVVPIADIEVEHWRTGMKVTTTYDLSHIHYLTVEITSRDRLYFILWSVFGTLVVVNGISYLLQHMLEPVFSISLAAIIAVAAGLGQFDRAVAEGRAERRARSELQLRNVKVMQAADVPAFLAGKRPDPFARSSPEADRPAVRDSNRIGHAVKAAGILSILVMLPVAQTVLALFSLGLSIWARRYEAEMDDRGSRSLRVGFACSIVGLVLSIVVLVALFSLGSRHGGR